MRNGAKAALVGGVFAVMVGGAGYGAYNLVSGVSGGGGSAGPGPEQVRTGPPTGGEVRDTARQFLTAWAKGDAGRAAAYTNHAEAALSALTGYREDARLTKVRLTPKRASGARVPFSVSATVSYKGRSKPLAYDSELTVVRGETTGRPLVDWSAAVLHPALKKGDTLVTGEAKAPALQAVDRAGTVLHAKQYPSLGPILADLRTKYARTAGGSPGVELYVRHADEDAGTRTLLTLAKGRPGKLRTTLSAPVQKAAEQAVLRNDDASVVAVEPSTGEVLAVANHREDGWNAAFLGKVAPGSTMKIVSAAMFLDKGVATADGPAPCPATATWQSQTFHNLTGLAPDESATFAESFARSCNTAFVKLVDEGGCRRAPPTRGALPSLCGAGWEEQALTFSGPSVLECRRTASRSMRIGRRPGRGRQEDVDLPDLTSRHASHSFGRERQRGGTPCPAGKFVVISPLRTRVGDRGVRLFPDAGDSAGARAVFDCLLARTLRAAAGTRSGAGNRSPPL
ncbi:penicillin-binding transpeptidase domain-containing protein [Streptomyces sp. NPDC005904]|uniref:penicillin-binding transpeptidase domain-containing protein n=1 Tax=Streptomyces sp. NPDC005904 TaxID=3154570 RepID=UPI0033C290FA